MEEYLTSKDVSRILQLGMTKTYDLIKKPDFPKIKIGGSIRVPKSELDKYMKKLITK